MSEHNQDKKETKEKPAAKHVSFPVTGLIIFGIVVLAFLALVLVKVPYSTRESYIDIEKVEVTKTVPDLNQMIDVQVCSDVPSNYRIEFNNFVKIVPIGKEYDCEASVFVWNEDTTTGKWTMSFTFNVNGKDFTVPEQTREILGKAKDEFVFKFDECTAGDTKSGNYNLITAPTKRECKYEQYPKNVTKTVLEEKQVQKERIVEKEETLLQSMLGTNKGDKA